MIRRLAIGCCVLLAGCASPVVTRIDAAAAAPLPARASFTLVSVPGEPTLAQSQANDMIAAGLTQRGWTQTDTGDYLLSVTLSDRPATSQLQAGDDAGKPREVIAPAADRKSAKGCAKRDHRLAVRLTSRVTGDEVYSGSGAEFHCKAALDDSLPHLVAAALNGLDGLPGARMVERKGVR
mgnify:CR=1 FL=1